MNDLDWCIAYLKEHNGLSGELGLSGFNALRALMNISMPDGLSDEFYERQDRVLSAFRETRDLVDASSLAEVEPGIALYKGDITLLKADAIVNAGNEQMLGCFQPLHGCIDNAIHSYAGLEVRRDMKRLMDEQGREEPPGGCKATKGYNLPARFVFHTVGPKGFLGVGRKPDGELASCYANCLKMATEMGLKAIAFPSISTGIYGYPFERAMKIAIKTVREYLKEHGGLKVVFDLFGEEEYGRYARELEGSAR